MTKTSYNESEREGFEGHSLLGGPILFYDDRSNGVMWAFEVPELGLRGFVRFTLEELRAENADSLIVLWQKKIEEMKAGFRAALLEEQEINEAEDQN